MAALNFFGTKFKPEVAAAGVFPFGEKSLEEKLHHIVVQEILSRLPTPGSVAAAQKHAYELINLHIRETGKVYRGCNFKTIEERDAFIVMALAEGLTVSNSTSDTQCYNGIPLSALFSVSSQRFAAKPGAYGVVFEIDAAKISYRPVHYFNEEECPLNISEAEVRTRRVPPDAIVAIHLRSDLKSLQADLRK